jgi:hypothetical protein
MALNEWYSINYVVVQYSLLAMPLVIIILAVIFARVVELR